MYEDDRLLLHTGNFAMQSALGFFSNNRYGAFDEECREEPCVPPPKPESKPPDKDAEAPQEARNA